MKFLVLFAVLSGLGLHAQSEPTSPPMHHEMQHGFILSVDDKFGSHLVATGHHSRQVEITGELSIESDLEKNVYSNRKSANMNSNSYFLFQAQSIDLPSIKAGQVLSGHIVESTVGKYEPKNIIVYRASFKIEKVILNTPNPFFAED